MARVIFTHDDKFQKWEVTVEGVESEEVRQIFAAVVLTCHEISANLQAHALVEKVEKYDTPSTPVHKVTPAVKKVGFSLN